MQTVSYTHLDVYKRQSFAQWVAEDKNCNNSVMCKLCKCIFTLSNIGVQALKSHEKGVKHKRAVANLSKTVDIRAFVTCPNQSSTTATVEESGPTSTFQ